MQLALNMAVMIAHVIMFINSNMAIYTISHFQAIVQPFITSILSLDSDKVLETAKDAAGARVFEAFLNSDVSVKLKRRLVSKYFFLNLNSNLCIVYGVDLKNL